MIDQSGLLVHKASTGKNREVWDTSNVIASRQLGMRLRIDFENNGLAGQVCGGACHFWGGHTARAAPCCPKIDQDRHTCVLNDIVEKLGIRRQRLIERWNRILTIAAAAGIGKMMRGNAIVAATVFAYAYGRHIFIVKPRAETF